MSQAGQSDERTEAEVEEEEGGEEAEAELPDLNDSHKDKGQYDLEPAAPNHHGQRYRANHKHHSRRHRPTKRKQHNIKPLEEGIYIFAGQMHTHLTGVASWTEHVRGGRLLGELQRDDHYSPHFQEIRLLPEPVYLAPGDALVHYCLYDTRSRPNVTLGGFATTEEMCVTYLHYYPKIDLEVCKSSVETRALEEYFDWLRKEEGQRTSVGADSSAGHAAEHQGAREPANAKSVSENYHSIDWSARRSRELMEFYARAPLSAQCNRSDGSRWPGNWEGIEPTRLANWPPERQTRKTSSRDQRDKRDEPLDFFKKPSARELVAYRGLGYRARHAQCLRRSARSEAELEDAD